MTEAADLKAIRTAYWAAMRRAAARARATLRPGDRLYVERCCSRSTITFTAFVNHFGLPEDDGRWIAGRTIDDVSPWCVLRVNGRPVSFRDAEGEEAVERFRQALPRIQAAARAARAAKLEAAAGDEAPF